MKSRKFHLARKSSSHLPRQAQLKKMVFTCFVSPVVLSRSTTALSGKVQLGRKAPSVTVRRSVRCEPVELRFSGGGNTRGRGGGIPPLERVLSSLPYLLPLLDGLSFGRYVIAAAPAALTTPALKILGPLYVIYRGIPFVGFAVFLGLYFATRANSISRFVRWNILQALLLDIALIVPQLLSSFRIGAGLPPSIVEIASSSVFYGILLAVGYAVISCVRGQLPDQVPLFSDSVNSQMPY